MFFEKLLSVCKMLIFFSEFSKTSETMSSKYKAQNVVLCDSCPDKLVSFNNTTSNITYPRCQNHAAKICELHCKQCTFPICASCVSSGDHDHHQKVDLLEEVSLKKI